MSDTPKTPPTIQRFSALNDLGEPSAQRGRSYSIMVQKLRWLLPMLALCIVLFLMVWPRIQNELENLRFKIEPIDKKVLEQAATETRLIDADFSSTDSKGRPYRVLADEAIQQNQTPDVIDLINPDASLKTADGQDITAKSQSGIINQKTNDLTLNTDVVITRPDGTVMSTQILHMNMETHDAHTDQPVAVTGPDMDLNANAMHTQNGGDIIIFTGPASLTLKQTKGSK